MSGVLRFARGNPCPVCGGHGSAPRGKGLRCHGYAGSDQQYLHCARVPFGEQENGSTWAHRAGPNRCNCGATHREPGAIPPPSRAPSPDFAKLWERMHE